MKQTDVKDLLNSGSYPAITQAIEGGKLSPDMKIDGIPLISFAVSHNQQGLLTALIAKGADVNAYASKPAWEQGMAPIHFAEHPDTVRLLAKAGANLDVPYKEVDHAWGMRGETRLHTVLLGDSKENLNLASALIQAGASVSIPFSAKEYSYPRDSTLAAGERVTRKGLTMAARMELLQQHHAVPMLAASVAHEAQPENAIQPVSNENAIQQVNIAAVKETSQVHHEQIPSPAGGLSEDSIQPIRKSGQDQVNRSRSNATVESSTDAIQRAPASSAPKHETSASMPKTLLNGRFIRDDEGIYRRQGETREALADEGEKIRFTDKQMDTFQAGVELAKAKGWQAILVTGTEQFRAEAWYQAKAAGLDVVGYEPTEKDLGRLANQQPVKLAEPSKSVQQDEHAKAVIASKKEAQEFALQKDFGVTTVNTGSGRYAGKLLHETDHHVVQDLGRQSVAIHEKRAFDPSVKLDVKSRKSVSLSYADGKASLNAKDRSQTQGLSR